MTDLREVVEEIGALADLAEASRWSVCRAVADAYAELGSYKRDLTPALMHRLTKSSDTIYDYRDAWKLREELGYVSDSLGLSYSHWAAMFEMRERFTLTKENCEDWLKIAEKDHLSVRDFRISVENSHREDEARAFQRHIRKLGKVASMIFSEIEQLKPPEALWQQTKTLYSVVQDWTGAAEEWMKGK